MELDLTRDVGAPPSTVWALLTDPPRMNAWSSARIEPIDPGDGDRMDGVGALRRVITPGLASARLVEVVQTSEPGARFVYRVFAGAPALRAHRGEITLAPLDAGTRVRWRVQMSFAVPGLERVARSSIGPELARSLDALARLAPASAQAPLPTFRAPSPVDLAPLRREAEAVLAAQRAIADRFEATGDPKQWFARVYAFVTEEQLAHAASGEVDHPEWVLRLIPRFHQAYADNLTRWQRDRASADLPWQKAWGCAERGDAQHVVKGLLLGVAAHIEADLPQALADTHRAHFATRCDYVRFRADYVRMAPIFRRASDRLMARMPRAFVPAWLRAARASLPPELEAELMRRYYDVPKRRLEAFARGAALARGA
jgi:uncharacterized protein YndB with AHSA1/START domain